MEKMPNDLILEIFKFFPPKTLATQLALVCRRWNNLAFSPCLWTQLDVEVKEFERFESYINPTLTRVAPGLRRLKLEMYTDRTFLPEVISTITELSNLVELCLSCCVDEITAETMSLLTIKCPLVQVAHMYECDQVIFSFKNETVWLQEAIHSWPLSGKWCGIISSW